MAESQYNFRASIPWHILLNYIEGRLKESDSKLRKVRGDDLLAQQGKSQVWEELTRLPDVLDALYTKDKTND